MRKFIVSIDQGTTSSRAILFDLKGKPVFVSQLEFTQYFPKDGWVEHNPEEIWKTTLKVLRQVISKSKKLKGKILTIGITNQRETTILWDKASGKPGTSRYVTTKNKINTPDRIELKKYNPILRKYTLHKEIK